MPWFQVVRIHSGRSGKRPDRSGRLPDSMKAQKSDPAALDKALGGIRILSQVLGWQQGFL
jgi:hypothetical protein